MVATFRLQSAEALAVGVDRVRPVHQRDPVVPAFPEQADGLEEVEPIRGPEQLARHASTFSPILGGHLRSSPSRPRTVAIKLVNEFIVQYKARKRSSTLAHCKGQQMTRINR